MKRTIMVAVAMAALALMMTGCAGVHHIKEQAVIPQETPGGKTVNITELAFKDCPGGKTVIFLKRCGVGNLKSFLQKSFIEAGFNPVDGPAEINVVPTKFELNKGWTGLDAVLYVKIDGQETRIEIDTHMSFFELYNEEIFTRGAKAVSEATAKLAKERLGNIPNEVTGGMTRSGKLENIKYEN